MRGAVLLVLIAALLVARNPARAASEPDTVERHAGGIRLTRIAQGLDHPVHLASAPGEARIFVVEQPGRIRVIENGRVRSEPFLDVSDRVSYGGERGLLSVAFHPRFAQNGWLFVDYTDRRGNPCVERFTATRDRQRADPASGRILITVEHPYANHNGGHLLFGPDRMLYVTLGDGGSAGDPGNRAQNPHVLLGKLLRLDVDHGDPYAIPRDNPFADGRGGRPEIWALGLRNPWRIAFDLGLLYIADVGQDLWEEVDVVRADRPGLNFGWRLYEGRHDFKRQRTEPRDLVFPVIEYGHDAGCSVTGGLVDRGRRVGVLIGRYLYSDYCKGWLRSFRFENGRAVERRRWDVLPPGQVTSFGQDGEGEVYLVTYEGAIFRIDPAR